MEFFKPSDFENKNMISGVPSRELIAEIANAKLNEALSSQVFIGNRSGTHWTTFKTDHDDHAAYLFNIQPIEECEHKNTFSHGPLVEDLKYICADCKKQVEPTGWRIKDDCK